MARKPKVTKPERPGVQVVLRVPDEVKDLLARTARAAGVSMNKAATMRLATGRWPKKEVSK